MPDGKSLVYSTFLGGGAVENARGKPGISIEFGERLRGR
jgi:hypothetical protein